MKIPSTKKLKKQAASFNRKRSKRIIKGNLSGISKVIKAESKQGRFNYHKTFTDNRDDFWGIFIAFRWLRRYSKLNVDIIEIIDKHSNKIRYVDQIEITIKWY